MSTIACALLVAGPSYSQQWKPSLASIASLRTGGAALVSSDALKMDDGTTALITYWEARSSRNLDVYRCIDVVDSAFRNTSQQCWTALRPTGRGPFANEDVVSSNDICGRPDDPGGVSAAAYCAFTHSVLIRTPYFGLVIEPLEDEGLVSVSDEGRTLSVTSSPWPSSAYLEVRATSRGERDFFGDTKTTSEILGLADADMQCELITVSNREWAACRSNDAPNVRTNYSIQDDTLYEVSFNEDVTTEVRFRLNRILSTLEPASSQ